MATVLSLRLATFLELIRLNVPTGTRLLEIGCGRGDLALELDRLGYFVTAIDPAAPEGEIFERAALEDFVAEDPFGAIVASLSLHHVTDPGGALDKVAGLLEPDGLLVVDEFAKERIRGATARWYHERRRALNPESISESLEIWLREWAKDHSDVHAFESLRRELDARFVERSLEWTPYLYDYRLDDSLEPIERELIAAGEIEPVGLRYVGQRR